MVRTTHQFLRIRLDPASIGRGAQMQKEPAANSLAPARDDSSVGGPRSTNPTIALSTSSPLRHRHSAPLPSRPSAHPAKNTQPLLPPPS